MTKLRHERRVVASHNLCYSIIRMEDNRESIADTCSASCGGDRENGEWWADRITLLLNFAVDLTNEDLAALAYEGDLKKLAKIRLSGQQQEGMPNE